MAESWHTKRSPFVERLPEDAVRAVHERSLTILGEMGIEIGHAGARQLLATQGCDVNPDTNVVTFPPDLVERSLEAAPASFTLHGRVPDSDVEIGGDEFAVSPSMGPPKVLEYGEGRRNSRMADSENFIKLAQMAEVVDVAVGGCEPNDVIERIKHLETLERNLLYTDMPPMAFAWGEDRARECTELVGIARGDPDLGRPYVIAPVTSVSPRCWDRQNVGGILEYARRGQPIILSAAVMAGASGPSTLAGALALANAEILAGITIVQVQNEGTPVVYGLPSSNVDIRYGSFATGSPESALFATVAAQLGRYYDIPSRGGGSLTDSRTVDEQAGAEATFNLLTAVLSGIDFVLHGVGILDSYTTMSPEKFVLDCDRIRYVDRFREGFALDEETFALDLVAETETKSHFLDRRHTLEHSQEEFLLPEVYFRDSYDNWETEGSRDSFARAHESVTRLLNEYERPPIDPDVERDVKAYLEEKRGEFRE